MTVMISLPRGINVDGKNILPMRKLVKLYEDLGLAGFKPIPRAEM